MYTLIMTFLFNGDRNRIRTIVDGILRRYRAPQSNFELLQRIARDSDLEVLEAHLHDLSGALRREDGRWRVYINRDDSPARQLFTLAHELGHFFLHREARSEFVDGDLVMNRDEDSKYVREELEANEFAGNLIMPAGQIERRLPSKRPTERQIIDLADFFRVSPLAMAIRLRTLGYGVPQFTAASQR